MKRARIAFSIVILVLGMGPLRAQDDPDVNSYGFGQILTHTQTNTGVVTQDANPYVFRAFVGGDANHITNATMTTPSQANFAIAGDTDFKFGASYKSSGYVDQASLDAIFPRTSGYSIHFETPTNVNGYTVSTLGLTGGVFPSVAPQVTGGGSWSGGTLLVDVTDEANYITFSAFTGMVPGTDLIVFDVWSTTDFRATTSGSQYDGTNFYVGPDQQTHVPYFIPGDTYQASVTFLKILSMDSSTVPGLADEIGYSFMATKTYFTIQAVPEPSTYALLAGGLGLIGLRQWRRRRQ